MSIFKSSSIKVVGLLLTLLLSFAVINNAYAQNNSQQQQATDLIRHLGDEVLQTVKSNPSQEQIAPRFRSLLKENFDIPLIGRFVLGQYWRQATDAQKQEYLNLVEDLIVAIYSNRFSKYSGQSFNVLGAHSQGQRDIIVTSQITKPGEQPVDVSWRLRPKDNSLKVIDVLVEGVSMSVTQREEFASIIQRTGGIDGLLQTMRERVGKYSTSNGK